MISKSSYQFDHKIKNKACKYYMWIMDPWADTQRNNKLKDICCSIDGAFRDEKERLRRHEVPASTVLPDDACLRKDSVSLFLLNVFILVNVPIQSRIVMQSQWILQCGFIKWDVCTLYKKANRSIRNSIQWSDYQ